MPENATDTRMPTNSFRANPCIRGKKTQPFQLTRNLKTTDPKTGETFLKKSATNLKITEIINLPITTKSDS